MKQISIIYWTGSGNTEQMANLISEGIKEKGNTVKLITVGDARLEDITEADIVLLGSPAMGAEVIEEAEMEPFVESIKSEVEGKVLGLFGSYDWGDGEWMENWADRMASHGAKVFERGCIAHLYPEGEDEEKCRDYGRRIVEV